MPAGGVAPAAAGGAGWRLRQGVGPLLAESELTGCAVQERMEGTLSSTTMRPLPKPYRTNTIESIRTCDSSKRGRHDHYIMQGAHISDTLSCAQTGSSLPRTIGRLGTPIRIPRQCRRWCRCVPLLFPSIYLSTMHDDLISDSRPLLVVSWSRRRAQCVVA
jgi:hypothetical protein